jgi:hypothetical protein
MVQIEILLMFISLSVALPVENMHSGSNPPLNSEDRKRQESNELSLAGVPGFIEIVGFSIQPKL